MSFSSKVKSEICRGSDYSKKEARAILSGVMKVSGTLTIGSMRQFGFRTTTENPSIARLVFKLLKEHFEIHSKLMVKKGNSLKKNNIYMVVIDEEPRLREFLTDIGVMQEVDGILTLDYDISHNLIEDDSNKKAFIKGAFLGGGSISNPEKAYHLEFVTHNGDYAVKLCKLVNSFGINSKVIQRKSSYIVYIKEGEQIVDILNIIGAHSSLLYLENIRVMKEMRNNVNRLVNCETANLGKTVNAAVRQIESIKLIQKEVGLNRLPANLIEIANLRLQYPDSSLKDLGEMLDPPVGKSGINHRLRKIEKIASEIAKGEY